MAKQPSQEKNYQDKIIQNYFEKYERDIEIDNIDAIIYRKNDKVKTPYGALPPSKFCYLAKVGWV